MVEPRARKYHRDRVAETLREEISGMIVGELADPRISFAYVSEVVINPGGKSARVYIAVDGGEVEEEKTREALTAARGFIRHELLERMGVRHVPELSFQIDKSKHLKLRIDELLGRNKKNPEGGRDGDSPKASSDRNVQGVAAASDRLSCHAIHSSYRRGAQLHRQSRTPAGDRARASRWGCGWRPARLLDDAAADGQAAPTWR